jgi:hypothetical protein
MKSPASNTLRIPLSIQRNLVFRSLSHWMWTLKILELWRNHLILSKNKHNDYLYHIINLWRIIIKNQLKKILNPNHWYNLNSICSNSKIIQIKITKEKEIIIFLNLKNQIKSQFYTPITFWFYSGIF